MTWVYVEDEKMSLIMEIKDLVYVMSKTKFSCPGIKDGYYFVDSTESIKMKNAIKLVDNFSVIYDFESKGYKLVDNIGSKIKLTEVDGLESNDILKDVNYTSNNVSRKFLEDMKKCEKSSSCDKNRYFMMSVYIDNENKCLVSTDGRRLVRAGYTDVLDFKFNKSNAVIVNKEWVKLVEEKKESKLLLSEKYICLENDSYYLFGKYIEGMFPNYRRVIPEYKDVVNHSIDFSILLNCPKTVVNGSTITNKNVAFWELSPIATNNALLPLEDNMSITFNNDYLVDLWKMLDKKVTEVKVGYNKEKIISAWRFTWDNMDYVLMPMNYQY